MDTRIPTFYFYSHRDQALARELLSHLILLHDLISISDGNDIIPGQNIYQAIRDRLDRAQLILLLLSPDFFYSEGIVRVRDVLDQAMEKQNAGEARVIPILLRPVDLSKSPLAQLPPLPTNGKPISKWSDRNLAYVEITEKIKQMITDSKFLTKDNEAQLREALLNFPERELKFLIFDMGIGSNIRLDTQETTVNQILMYVKKQNRMKELADYIHKKYPSSI